jgi:hypothetical protein
MKRRTFLTIAGIGGAIGLLTSFKFFTTSFEEAAATLIKEELSFLKLDPEGVLAFVEAYAKNRDRNYKLTMKGYNLLGINASQSGKIHQLVTSYMLSSDFFNNSMDESREIKYVAFYNPYARPCAHPFNHFKFPGLPA